MSYKIEDIKIGDSASMVRQVTEEDVVQMANVSKDFNPVHLDDEYAKTTRFGKRIAHGLFCVSMISALLGNELPGNGTIICSENMKFLYPVYLGDTITAQVKVENIVVEKSKIELSFSCENQDKRIVLTGNTVVVLENADV